MGHSETSPRGAAWRPFYGCLNMSLNTDSSQFKKIMHPAQETVKSRASAAVEETFFKIPSALDLF